MLNASADCNSVLFVCFFVCLFVYPGSGDAFIEANQQKRKTKSSSSPISADLKVEKACLGSGIL